MSDPRMMMSNMINAGVPSNKHECTSSVLPLPLNLIALIISFLDSPSDLARMCRTCRVFHYMTLPQLYSDVSLRSYDHIRYRTGDGRAQGCGMGSPFAMGLNGLVTRNIACYVRNLEICGEWKEHEVEEQARVGRVPDETMLLNTLVRVAVEKMTALNSFKWDLNSKMLPITWHGLAQSASLTKLTVKFPSQRHPRPITLVPPIPNLEYLHLIDIDPLCYIDDVSLLLLGSKKLKHLKMHFNPRMRGAREPSINQAVYFGRCVAARCPLSLKSIAVQNLYTQQDSQCAEVFAFHQLEEGTFLNSTGGINDTGATAFLDAVSGGWRKANELGPENLKMLRVDKVSRDLCGFLFHIQGLERIYLIDSQTHTARHSTTQFPRSPASTISSPSSQDTSNLIALKDEYLDAITKRHGATLKHLLLLPQWRLTDDDIALIVRQCPNLEQLGIGVEFSSFGHLRLLVPFLSRLTAIRLLGNPDDSSFVDEMRDIDAKGMHEEKIGEETVNSQWNRFRYMEVGAPDMIFEVGKRQLQPRAEPTQPGMTTKETYRRSVKRRTWEQVKDIAIWKMDNPDL